MRPRCPSRFSRSALLPRCPHCSVNYFHGWKTDLLRPRIQPATQRKALRILRLSGDISPIDSDRRRTSESKSSAIPSSRASTSWISAATPSAASTSLTSFTAAGCQGHSATYRTSTLTWHPLAYLGFFHSKSDNERTAFSSLGCNGAGPNADRAQGCEGWQVSAVRQRAFLAVGGALVHTVVTGFLADLRDREFR